MFTFALAFCGCGFLVRGCVACRVSCWLLSCSGQQVVSSMPGLAVPEAVPAAVVRVCAGVYGGAVVAARLARVLRRGRLGFGGRPAAARRALLLLAGSLAVAKVRSAPVRRA